MKLTETGEARIRGYLFLLGRSLRASLPRPVAVDALAELESHIRERLAQAEPLPNEEAAVERVLHLAQRYLGWWRGRHARSLGVS